MNIFSFIIQLFHTPACILLSLTILVKVCGTVFSNLHISSKDITIAADSKEKKHKK